MIRTQVYLTEEEHVELKNLSSKSGRSKSDLIREAIDTLIEKKSHRRKLQVIRETAGIWKDRTDLPDLRKLREEWDRR
ncbi:MAG: ribbon-helix-helix domain-containing protein [Verrucomicrobia bacterium]|nr:ribbon-helix-helix domain-containing protein [Verrucomicrobiota bacterium]